MPGPQKETLDRNGSEIAAEGLRRIAAPYRTLSEIRGVGPRPGCVDSGLSWHIAGFERHGADVA